MATFRIGMLRDYVGDQIAAVGPPALFYVDIPE